MERRCAATSCTNPVEVLRTGRKRIYCSPKCRPSVIERSARPDRYNVRTCAARSCTRPVVALRTGVPRIYCSRRCYPSQYAPPLRLDSVDPLSGHAFHELAGLIGVSGAGEWDDPVFDAVMARMDQ